MRSLNAKILIRLRVLLLTVGASLSTVAVAASGFVYQVSKDGGAANFLIGTMHSEDARVVALLDSLQPLIERVDTVAVEVIPDAVAMLALGAATLLPAELTLREQIGEQRFAELEKAVVDADIPITVLDRMRPWAVAVTLGMPARKTGRFLDMEIYLSALDKQRKVVGLETAAEQIAVFDQMPSDVELMLLDEVIEGLPEMSLQFETLTVAYLEGDLEQLDRLVRDYYGDLPEPLRRWYDDRLLAQRNEQMLQRLLTLLGEGRALAAVGALHLGGDSGLIAGLRRAGYDVERCCGSE